jgi:hypothetical protein
MYVTNKIKPSSRICRQRIGETYILLECFYSSGFSGIGSGYIDSYITAAL